MKLRNSLNLVLFAAITVVLFALIAVDPVSPGSDPPALRPADSADEPVENVELPSEVNVGSPAPTESADLQATTVDGLSQDDPAQDGPTLLRVHCSQCHAVRLLERSERPRAAWEKILLRMEKAGVHLTDGERSVLIDHLASPDEP